MNHLKVSRQSLFGMLVLPAAIMYSCTKDSAQKKEQLASSSGKNAATTQSISAIVHPGILNTKTNLDLIRSQANVSGSSRYNDYNNTVVKFMTDNPIPTSFPATVIVAGGSMPATERQFKIDALLAYAAALRWAKTGSSTYANQAKFILNGWATNFRNIDNADGTSFEQTYLEASWTTPTFAAAAEIIRHYKPGGTSAGWSSTDITKFETFLNLLKNTYVNKVMTTSHDNNWTASAGYAKMAVGVFTNSVTEYQAGVDVIKGVIPKVIYSDGSMEEYCDRMDCTHYQYSLTALTYAAEIARMQSDTAPIYSYLSNRINAGYTYMKKAFDQTVPGCNYCNSTSRVYPGVEIAYKYYNNSTLEYLRGLKAPYAIKPDILFLGFTTYTHYNTN